MTEEKVNKKFQRDLAEHALYLQDKYDLSLVQMMWNIQFFVTYMLTTYMASNDLRDKFKTAYCIMEYAEQIQHNASTIAKSILAGTLDLGDELKKAKATLKETNRG